MKINFQQTDLAGILFSNSQICAGFHLLPALFLYFEVLKFARYIYFISITTTTDNQKPKAFDFWLSVIHGLLFYIFYPLILKFALALIFFQALVFLFLWKYPVTAIMSALSVDSEVSGIIY